MPSPGNAKELIRRLPKAELHLHIEGSLEPDMVFALAARNGIDLPYASQQELMKRYDFKDLQSFLDLYYQATAVLLTEEDFFDLTWAYLKKCQADRVVHTEIFFDPQSHTSRGVPFAVVIGGIRRALHMAERELGVTSRLIMCFLRHLPAADAFATWKMAAPFLNQIDGVGLDSSERDFPPGLFREVFALARAAGLQTVAHAGEEGPPAYIREAIDLLQVARIDHGVRITEAPQLLAEVAERKIPLTVCPLSNVRLRVYDTMDTHPILALLDQGVRVMVNSDDPAYFGGYVNANYEALIDALAPTPEQLIALVKNSFLSSFLDEASKHSWLQAVDEEASRH
ncbi:adenosine deaminase [Exilibacterium tricleocarpae]|uniref:Adenine deaminase n=1 Tax=Exilibacterium tricleocarpae TaxID=2591008 RepID=A0A545U9X7_9GAMM|nr:adenosine deaminase [Exilibacterium tricleocarpae]TQV86213.1 adenosine deaminase [Exilibacterium tricleocarpae]